MRFSFAFRCNLYICRKHRAYSSLLQSYRRGFGLKFLAAARKTYRKPFRTRCRQNADGLRYQHRNGRFYPLWKAEPPFPFRKAGPNFCKQWPSLNSEATALSRHKCAPPWGALWYFLNNSGWTPSVLKSS